MNDGGPAFPRTTARGPQESHGYCLDEGNDGMSLRDWFAAQILPTILAADFEDRRNRNRGSEPAKVVEAAYAIADLMLKEREAKDAADDQ